MAENECKGIAEQDFIIAFNRGLTVSRDVTCPRQNTDSGGHVQYVYQRCDGDSDCVFCSALTKSLIKDATATITIANEWCV